MKKVLIILGSLSSISAEVGTPCMSQPSPACTLFECCGTAKPDVE